jgi:hypothetical protein
LVKEEVIRVDNFDIEWAEDIGGKVTDIKGYNSVGPTISNTMRRNDELRRSSMKSTPY